MVDREGGCMRGVRKDPIIGGAVCPGDIRLSFYGGGENKFHLTLFLCLGVCRVWLLFDKNCVDWKEEQTCVYWKGEWGVLCWKEERVIPSLITGISPKDNFVCSHFFPSTDHLFLQ